MLIECCEAKGISPYALGAESGIKSRSVMSYVVRARKSGERGYLPPLQKLEAWADRLGLTGGHRKRFLLLGSLEHCPPLVQEHLREVEARLSRLEGRAKR